MAPGIRNLYGVGSEVPSSEELSAMRALPASWYTAATMFELERRAIFSKKWLLVTHSHRLKGPGDFLKYTIAGFQFVLCRDRQGTINAFHNVCRHRAFPVVQGDAGTASIFSCKYHGWSYGLKGNLAKAPGYQELPGFDKSANGLFPIHVHIDKNGFIFVNLDAKAEPEIKWDDELAGSDTQARYSEFDWNDYEYDHTWQMEGDYNWKILADNYNECYHCKTSHPDIGEVADLQVYKVKPSGSQIVHLCGTTDEQRSNGLTICSTYYFPNASATIAPHFFMVQKFLPSGPKHCVMQYEVFRNKNSSEEDFQLVNQIFKRIMSEDKDLCDQAQKNLNAGVFVNGELHPQLEMGPLYFQKVVRDTVTAHHERERELKQEIRPAQQKLPDTATASKEDVDFCTGLSCGPTQEALAW